MRLSSRSCGTHILFKRLFRFDHEEIRGKSFLICCAWHFDRSQYVMKLVDIGLSRLQPERYGNSVSSLRLKISSRKEDRHIFQSGEIPSYLKTSQSENSVLIPTTMLKNWIDMPHFYWYWCFSVVPQFQQFLSMRTGILSLNS